jgi:bacillithiol synthase
VNFNHQQIELTDTGVFPKLFLDYISKNENLRSLYNEFPDIEGFGKLIETKKIQPDVRKTLVASLQKQYEGIENAPDFSTLLNENTFTVTTGHQLNIFTGPLYVIYKIVTTIRLAEELKKAYPSYNFVPIYWMATEDHDFEEIASFSLFGKTYTWETTQRGAVGRMNPASLETILNEMPVAAPPFVDAYLQQTTLANAVRFYMHSLFGAKGLVCLDADAADLKRCFATVIKDDLLQHTANKIVTETTQTLANLGYKTQISPREINFFYLEDGLRERIVKENGTYQVQNTTLQFSEEQLLELIEQSPEKFSPNVVLRPLYQEMILPNLAYIGGPSEVPYWLQLKGIFDHFGVQFPALMPRNFALIVNQTHQKKLDKLGVDVTELFGDEVTLRRNFVARNSDNSLSLAFEIDEINDVFQRIVAKSVSIDPTLKAVVEAENTKVEKALDNLEKRLKKAEERNYETALTQLFTTKEKLFPGGGLQERKENFLNFSSNNPQFLDQLFEAFQPLDYRFSIIEL